jgi:NADPH:quinone reductase-like Zn-dependent oxidoreductase
MKAAVYHGYGLADVVHIEDVAKPVPKDDEVLIQVRAASVNPLDAGLMKGKPHTFRLFFGLLKPRLSRPGVDVAGDVETVGAKVTRIKAGDQVFGSCRGAFAEYACTSESKLAIKPDDMTFEEAASVPVAGLTALQGLRDKGRVRRGQKVLIHSAAGGVGTFAVQIAKWMGAEVTGVCSSSKVELVRSIGADRVIDYTREDFTKGTERYDVIFDCYVNHSLTAYKRVLNRNGIFVMVGGPSRRWFIQLMTPLLQALLLAPVVSQKFVTFIAKIRQEDLELLRELMAAGRVKPIIDRCYRLSDVSEAIRYLDGRHARGKVVVSCGKPTEGQAASV